MGEGLAWALPASTPPNVVGALVLVHHRIASALDGRLVLFLIFVVVLVLVVGLEKLVTCRPLRSLLKLANPSGVAMLVFEVPLPLQFCTVELLLLGFYFSEDRVGSFSLEKVMQHRCFVFIQWGLFVL